MTVARLALFALASSAALTPALAVDEVRTRTVEYADLDLASERGVARLNRRIDHAIDEVCGARTMARDIAAIRDVKACRAAAEERARLAANEVIARETRLAVLATPAG